MLRRSSRTEGKETFYVDCGYNFMSFLMGYCGYTWKPLLWNVGIYAPFHVNQSVCVFHNLVCLFLLELWM